MKDHVLVRDGKATRWCPVEEYQKNPARFEAIEAKAKAKAKAKAPAKGGK